MTADQQPASSIELTRDESSTVTIRIRVWRLPADYRRHGVVLILYIAALVSAFHACDLLRGDGQFYRDLESDLIKGGPYVGIAIGFWLLAELIRSWGALRNWQVSLDRLERTGWLLRVLPLVAGLAALSRLVDAMFSTPDTAFGLVEDALLWLALAAIVWLSIEVWKWQVRKRAHLPRFQGWVKAPAPPAFVNAEPPEALFPWRSISLARILLIAVATFSSAVVWVNTTNNRFLAPYFVLWLLSALLWVLVFVPIGWKPIQWFHDKFYTDWRIPWRKYWWAYIAFALIMIFGAGFRLVDLDKTPPELMNDTYLNIIDAYHLAHGDESPIYFSYNNGRALMLYYSTAALAYVPGFGFNYYTIKMVTALASVCALPFMFFLGKEFAGPRGEKRGVVLGLLLSGLVAGSVWDVILVRMGLEFGLLPLFAAPFGWFLLRALRHNRRADYVIAGLILGFSLYTYTSARGFPIVAVAAFLVAMALKKISWRERSVYLANFVVLALIAFVVFLPMFHYMLEYPDNFWQRFQQTVLESGGAIEEAPETLERIVVAFMFNIRKHLRMYHLVGNSDFSLSLDKLPAMDEFSGALLILGVAAMAAQMLRSRDLAIWMLPVLIFFMHVPSLIVADPVGASNTPSNQRSIGAVPYIYLLAALPLMVMARQLLRLFPKPIALLLGALLCAAMLLLSFQRNNSLYFTHYHDGFVDRTLPMSEGGRVIRAFVDGGGAYENVFIVGGPDVGETRFVFLEANDIFPQNDVIYNPRQIPNDLSLAWSRAEKPLSPDLDLFFLLGSSNTEAAQELRRLFPHGSLTVIRSRIRERHRYAVFRVPAMGPAGFNHWLQSAARG